MSFWLKFWGTRGTVPCATPSCMRYGGNTSCVEIRAGSHHLLLDAGTGLRALGQRWLQDRVGHATLLLSHFHLDHIAGLPFFAPAFRNHFWFDIVAAPGRGKRGDVWNIQTVLALQMESPLFPVPLDDMGCAFRFKSIHPGDSFALRGGEVEIQTAALNHPGGATAYRINFQGRSLAYVTDTEHIPGRLDQQILQLIEGCDVVLYDATYTEQEYAQHIGWGHSTWLEGVRLVREAGARELVLFHHHPDHDDEIMVTIERQAQELWPASTAAREGTTIELA